VLIDRSESAFSQADGRGRRSKFRKWKANDFRPKGPRSPAPSSRSETGSIITRERNQERVRKTDWFDTAKFPVARFA
jgi:hypothetical protein